MSETPSNTWLRFAGYAAQRFLADACPRQAAGLSYVSLLAIVPLIAVGFAVLPSFPIFEAWRADVQAFIADNLLPDVGVEISSYLETFIDNASNMTTPGLIGLAVVAFLLMANITGVFNLIWRVAKPQPLALRLAVYGVLLILGPLLIGASLSVSGYAFAAIEWFGLERLPGGLHGLSWLVSLILAVLGFALLYFLVPNRPIHPGNALVGGLAAAALLEILKLGFGLYLRHFPAYEVIYGAVAAIPIFLVWMYLSWVIALFGAEITAALPEWRAAQGRDPGGREHGIRKQGAAGPAL